MTEYIRIANKIMMTCKSRMVIMGMNRNTKYNEPSIEAFLQVKALQRSAKSQPRLPGCLFDTRTQTLCRVDSQQSAVAITALDTRVCSVYHGRQCRASLRTICFLIFRDRELFDSNCPNRMVLLRCTSATYISSSLLPKH